MSNDMRFNQKIITIERYIFDHQPDYARGDFTNLLYDIAMAAKMIANKTTRAGLADILGAAGNTNVQGEEQQRLDIYADKTIYRLVDHTGRVCVMASEEHEDVLDIPPEFQKGRYVLVYDPLDGSSNIDVNVSIGTIFGVYRCVDWAQRGRVEDCLQPASKLLAAGYVLYGSSTMLVYSTGQGVHGFTLDPHIGEFLLSHPNIRFPDPPTYFSANHGNFEKWSDGIKNYMRWIHGGHPDEKGPGLSERYIGSLVADFHRNLLRGGVFLYPGEREKPEGKIRLLYEAAPLAFLAHQAGGYSSDGRQNLLDITPRSLHQRTPIIIGNHRLVQKAEEFIIKYDNK